MTKTKEIEKINNFLVNNEKRRLEQLQSTVLEL